MTKHFLSTLLFFILSLSFTLAIPLYGAIKISGKVKDYQGTPVDSCNVMVYNPDFTVAYETLSDQDGNYAIENVQEGKYAGICAMRIKEYPRMNKVAPELMNLEFWAWNLIADRDIDLDLRYGKLELYGTTAFSEFGGRPELLIYTRAMSLAKALAYVNINDKASAEKETNITVPPRYMEFEVKSDNVPLKILSVQHLSLPNSNGNKLNDDCYIIQTELPLDYKREGDKPFEIRVIGHNTQYDEWGENVYYLMPSNFTTVKKK